MPVAGVSRGIDNHATRAFEKTQHSNDMCIAAVPTFARDSGPTQTRMSMDVVNGQRAKAFGPFQSSPG